MPYGRPRAQSPSVSIVNDAASQRNRTQGNFQFKATKPGTTALGLEEAHRELRISPAEFDEVAVDADRWADDQ